MPHARQRCLNQKLVPGVATGHKTKWSLQLHEIKADGSMREVWIPARQASYTRANAAANRGLLFRASTSFLASVPRSFRRSSRFRSCGAETTQKSPYVLNGLL